MSIALESFTKEEIIEALATVNFEIEKLEPYVDSKVKAVKHILMLEKLHLLTGSEDKIRENIENLNKEIDDLSKLIDNLKSLKEQLTMA